MYAHRPRFRLRLFIALVAVLGLAETSDVRAQSRRYNESYEGPYLNRVAFPIGGIGAGMIIGSLITLYFQTHGIDFSGASELLSQFGITGRMYPKLSLLSVTSGPLAVWIITFLAALYPALKVRRLQPAEAMRAV